MIEFELWCIYKSCLFSCMKLKVEEDEFIVVYLKED